MIKYGISVRESLHKTVIVEANNIEEAIIKVEKAVERGEIILDVDDYVGCDIFPSEYWEDGIVPEDENVNYYWHLEEKEHKKVCISLKMLYESGHTELHYGGIIQHTKEDESDYYDLLTSSECALHVLCDGEQVEVIDEYPDSVVVKCQKNKIWFTPEEFAIAAFQ